MIKEFFDLFLFMGQSNMAGRGIVSDKWSEAAPDLLKGAGYEYRAISDRNALYPISEPFGLNENNPNGIFEPGMKTGSMVSSFVNAYYERGGVPIIGISASKGGSFIEEWQGENDFLSDAMERFENFEKYAKEKDINIRHRFMLWCQGESDGDNATDPDTYNLKFKNMFAQMQNIGIEKCFLITIGEYNGDKGYDYSAIRAAQLELCKEFPNVILACDDFHKMRERGLMKDDFHYFQKAYNEVGEIAGRTVGEYVSNI